MSPIRRAPRTPRPFARATVSSLAASLTAFLAASLAVCLATATVAVADPAHWPQFRGPNARGVVDQPAPLTWSVSENENILWRTDVPGLGHSSPVVWGDTVFLTTAVRQGQDDDVKDGVKIGLYGDIDSVEDDSPHRWLVLAYDAATGREKWRREAHQGVPATRRHLKSSHANPTPTVDAERVVVLFGSEGLHAFSHAGEPLWSKDLGTLDAGFFRAPDAQWGFGSSPVLHDGKVLVQADVQKGSFLAAFDAATGKQLWRRDRDDVPTWSTPTVVGSGKDAQVVINGFKRLGGYDLATGEPRWWMPGGGDIPVPTPFEADGKIVFTNSHGVAQPILVVRTDARGDLTKADEEAANPPIVWSQTRGGAYMPTPIVVDDLLYLLRDNGILNVYELATGKKVYDARLGGGATAFTASPVAAGGHVYFPSETGDIFVVEAGREHRLVATNPLDEIVLASPAVAEGRLFFRTRDQLVAVGKSRPTEASGRPPSKPAPEPADEGSGVKGR